MAAAECRRTKLVQTGRAGFGQGGTSEFLNAAWGGHRQCEYLSRPGNTVPEAAAALRAQFRGISVTQAYGVVDAAVTAYCDQYRGEL